MSLNPLCRPPSCDRLLKLASNWYAIGNSAHSCSCQFGICSQRRSEFFVIILFLYLSKEEPFGTCAKNISPIFCPLFVVASLLPIKEQGGAGKLELALSAPLPLKIAFKLIPLSARSISIYGTFKQERNGVLGSNPIKLKFADRSFKY